MPTRTGGEVAAAPSKGSRSTQERRRALLPAAALSITNWTGTWMNISPSWRNTFRFADGKGGPGCVSRRSSGGTRGRAGEAAVELNQPRRRERASRRVSERKQACEVWRKISQLAVPKNQSLNIFRLVRSMRSPRTSPGPSPITRITACAGGKPVPAGSGRQGWRYVPCTPSLLRRELCGGLLQRQASPRASTAARRWEPALGATPSRTGSDQEFLVRARKKGFCLNDVLGLYFPGLTHSLEGKRSV